MFISSGDDAARVRDRLETVITKVVNSQLHEERLTLRLEAVRWEDLAARRNAVQEGTNEAFVRLAVGSSVMVAILLDTVGEHTKEEIEAVLSAPEVELKVLWFPQPGSDGRSAAARYLKQRRNDIRYNKIEGCDLSQDMLPDVGWYALIGNIISVLITALRGPDEYHEIRPS